MTDGNNGRPLHEAVPGPTPEQVAQVNAAREAQMRAVHAEIRRTRRESLAGIILNGICCGLYQNYGELVPDFGPKAVHDAVQFADALMAELDKVPAAPPAASG